MPGMRRTCVIRCDVQTTEENGSAPRRAIAAVLSNHLQDLEPAEELAVLRKARF